MTTGSIYSKLFKSKRANVNETKGYQQMAKKGDYLTTKEYAEQMGMTVSTVTKQLRSGKIKGVKQGGKWMIPAGAAAPKKAAAKKSAPKKPAPAKPSPKSPSTAQPAAAPAAQPVTDTNSSYSVEEFSKMTFLTPFGVTEWLKKGILNGSQTSSGDWRVDGSSLTLDQVKRLLR